MNTRCGSGPQQINDFCGYVVGQHVVCIEPPCAKTVASILLRGGTANIPIKGKVYTVREVYSSIKRDGVFIRLAELRNKPLPSPVGPWEPGFSAKKFRPLQKLTPEMFLSADAPVKQGAPA